MNQEKGITMISLIVVIIILIILIGIGISAVSPLVQKSNVQDLKTELMLIQAKWETEREKVNFDGTSILDQGLINTQDSENKGKLKDEFKYTTNGEPWVEDNVKAYYKLPGKALENMGIKLDNNFGYLVNYENDEIIYIPGFEDEEGNMHYKLSDIKQL